MRIPAVWCLKEILPQWVRIRKTEHYLRAALTSSGVVMPPLLPNELNK
jgi:hypothetical protein